MLVVSAPTTLLCHLYVLQLDPIKVKAVRKQPPGTAPAPADKKGNAGKKTKAARPAGSTSCPGMPFLSHLLLLCRGYWQQKRCEAMEAAAPQLRCDVASLLVGTSQKAPSHVDSETGRGTRDAQARRSALRPRAAGRQPPHQSPRPRSAARATDAMRVGPPSPTRVPTTALYMMWFIPSARSMGLNGWQIDGLQDGMAPPAPVHVRRSCCCASCMRG
jgi:hypothetical protein